MASLLCLGERRLPDPVPDFPPGHSGPGVLRRARHRRAAGNRAVRRPAGDRGRGPVRLLRVLRVPAGVWRGVRRGGPALLPPEPVPPVLQRPLPGFRGRRPAPVPVLLPGLAAPAPTLRHREEGPWLCPTVPGLRPVLRRRPHPGGRVFGALRRLSELPPVHPGLPHPDPLPPAAGHGVHRGVDRRPGDPGGLGALRLPGVRQGLAGSPLAQKGAALAAALSWGVALLGVWSAGFRQAVLSTRPLLCATLGAGCLVPGMLWAWQAHRQRKGASS